MKRKHILLMAVISILFCFFSSDTLEISASESMLPTDHSSFSKDENYTLKEYELYTYDDDGNELEWHKYNADGEEQAYRISTYDEHGEWIERRSKSSYSNKEEVRQRSITYNAEGRFDEIRDYTEGELKYIYKYCYRNDIVYTVKAFVRGDREPTYEVTCIPDSDAVNGHAPGWQACYSYNSDKSLKNLIYMHYDENGHYTYKGQQDGQILYVSGSENDESEEGEGPETEAMAQEWIVQKNEDNTGTEEYIIAGNLQSLEQLEFDTDGNKIRGFKYQKTYFDEAYWSTYRNGNQILMVDYSYYRLEDFGTYLYDDRGNLIEEIEFNSHDHYYDKTVKSYQYDENNNLTACYSYRIEGLEAKLVQADGSSVEIERHVTNSGWDVDIKSISIYDAKHNLLEQYSFSENGKFNLHYLYDYEQYEKPVLYQYDREGNIVVNGSDSYL